MLQAGVWSEKVPNSTVQVEWCYIFQDGFCVDLIHCIVAASKNYNCMKTVLAHWQTGLIVRIGDVDILMALKDQLYQLEARCKISNGNRQALNMAWSTLAQFIYITESYLLNFPGLFYKVGKRLFFIPSVLPKRY